MNLKDLWNLFKDIYKFNKIGIIIFAIILFISVTACISWSPTELSEPSEVSSGTMFSWASEGALLDIERTKQWEKDELLKQIKKIDEVILEIRTERNNRIKPDYLSVNLPEAHVFGTVNAGYIKPTPRVEPIVSEVSAINNDRLIVLTSKDCNFTLHNEVATEIGRYICNKHNDPIMLASFMQESWFNPNARWTSWEYGICQMMPNSTNLVWINDDRWSDRQWQADRCVDKWKAVPWKTKGLIWASYGSNAHAKYLHYFQ